MSAGSTPHQIGHNGPLSPEFRGRINHLRSHQKLTLADVGRELGVSGPFMSNLLKKDHPGSVRSIHIPRFVKAVERLEVQAGIRKPSESDEKAGDAQNVTGLLEDLIRIANSKGFAVTFTPLPRE